MHQNNYNPLAEPPHFDVSEEEVKQVTKLALDKYDIELPKTASAKLAKKIKKLTWWQAIVGGKASVQPITDANIFEMYESLELNNLKEYTREEIKDTSNLISTIIPFQEQRRLTTEIKGILVKYRPIPNNPAVTRKMIDLLSNNYNLELEDDRLEQIIQYNYRSLWLEKGLDASMVDCLDSLLANKKNRGQSAKLGLYDSIEQAFNKAIAQIIS